MHDDIESNFIKVLSLYIAIYCIADVTITILHTVRIHDVATDQT